MTEFWLSFNPLLLVCLIDLSGLPSVIYYDRIVGFCGLPCLPPHMCREHWILSRGMGKAPSFLFLRGGDYHEEARSIVGFDAGRQRVSIHRDHAPTYEYHGVSTSQMDVASCVALMNSRFVSIRNINAVLVVRSQVLTPSCHARHYVTC